MKIANAFSIKMVPNGGTLGITPICLSSGCDCCQKSVQDLLSSGIESYVGHADTALLLSALIGVEIPMNRASMVLNEGESCIIAQYDGPRLPEGSIRLPEGSKFTYYLISLQLQNLPNKEYVIKNKANLPYANLQGIDLSNADLSYANLQRVNLYGANLFCVDLSNANLQGANLQGADLSYANLSHANLQGATLQGANLQGADLHNADLYEADLYKANLQGVNLYEANLQGAGLCKVNLSKADLSNANLHEVDLHEVDLHEADLHEANLYGADLQGANLQGANLQGANLHNVILIGTKGINSFTAACLNICPEGDLIVYKKCLEGIVKLRIPSDALRSNASGRKCRASKVIVLETPGNVPAKSYTNEFIYEVGKVVLPDSFDPDRWNECSNGIHFFLTKEEAEKCIIAVSSV